CWLSQWDYLMGAQWNFHVGTQYGGSVWERIYPRMRTASGPGGCFRRPGLFATEVAPTGVKRGAGIGVSPCGITQ
ncbi:MAG: hypothetical protein KKC77_02740, partial [Proteobacteria bacterium]|nr:hypothetical protein [Pseudomonadota bacterium]